MLLLRLLSVIFAVHVRVALVVRALTVGLRHAVVEVVVLSGARAVLLESAHGANLRVAGRRANVSAARSVGKRTLVHVHTADGVHRVDSVLVHFVLIELVLLILVLLIVVVVLLVSAVVHLLLVLLLLLISRLRLVTTTGGTTLLLLLRFWHRFLSALLRRRRPRARLRRRLSGAAGGLLLLVRRAPSAGGAFRRRRRLRRAARGCSLRSILR